MVFWAFAITAFGRDTGSVHEAGSGHDLEPGPESDLGHFSDPGLDLDIGSKSAWVDVLEPVSVIGKHSSSDPNLGTGHGLVPTSTTALELPTLSSVTNAPTSSGAVSLMPDKFAGGSVGFRQVASIPMIGCLQASQFFCSKPVRGDDLEPASVLGEQPLSLLGLYHVSGQGLAPASTPSLSSDLASFTLDTRLLCRRSLPESLRGSR